MIQGSLPATTIYGTWVEQVEILNMDDDSPFDLSGMVEITLSLYDNYLEFAELTISMSNGQITVPSDGIIEWRVERGQMGTLMPKAYRAVLILKDGDTGIETPLILGPISIIG